MKSYKVSDQHGSETIFYARNVRDMERVVRICYGKSAAFAHINLAGDAPADVIAAVEKFEAESQEKYDPAGPTPAPCGECGKMMQFYFNAKKQCGHTCSGLEAASQDAARDDEMAHGSGD